MSGLAATIGLALISAPICDECCGVPAIAA
jgi:hypothetical protein